jgi:PAS domain S-box-containing protein
MRATARNGLPLSLLAMSLRQLLTALVFGTAVPLFVLALIMLQQLIAHERQAVRDGLMSNARSLGALVDNEIDTHMVLAATLATSLALESGDLGTFRTQAERALTVVPGAWGSLIDPAGQVVMTTLPGVTLPTQPPGKARLDAMAKAFATGKPQVSDIETGRLSKRPAAVIEFPVFKAGVPLYSVVIGLDPDRFHRLIRDKFGEKTVVAIIDRQRRFIARVPGQEASLGALASPGWQAALDRTPEGVAEYPTIEGTPSLQAYVTTREGWAVGIAYATEALEVPVRRILWSMGVLGLTLTLVSLAFAFGLGRRLSGVMSGLVTAAQGLGHGDIVASEAFPIQEATAISEALHHASEQLSRREMATARLAAIVTSSTDAIVSKTLDGTITSWNSAAEHIFGYTASEMTGQSVRRLIPPERQPEEDAILTRLRAGENIESFDTIRLHKDYRPIDVSVTISPIRDSSGNIVGASKIVRDITERKQAQDHLRFLLNEVAHRSKNQLALVQSMMRQTAGSTTSLAEFQKSFGERIQGLAVSINMLVAEKWTGAALGKLVCQQLEAFDVGDARLECEGPGVTVSADAAQAIGLALHELATNSFKHGAWSASAGVVTVSWHIERNESETSRLSLRWQERRGPVVTPPTRKGFGHMVIDTMIAQKLDAVVDMAFEPQGLCWTVTIPSTHFAADSSGQQRDRHDPPDSQITNTFVSPI